MIRHEWVVTPKDIWIQTSISVMKYDSKMVNATKQQSLPNYTLTLQAKFLKLCFNFSHLTFFFFDK